MKKQKEALEAVLMFHSTAPWDDKKMILWTQLTGRQEATTKVLCDIVRAALLTTENATDKIHI